MGYLMHRLFQRITIFLCHWYIDGSRAIRHQFVRTIKNIDRRFGLVNPVPRPPIKDSRAIAKVSALAFRAGKILVGGFIVLLIAVIFLVLYLAWIGTPVVIVILALKNL